MNHLLHILIVTLFILLAICIFNRRLMENFIVTVEETILPSNCPDYLVTDGQYYYLIFNNKEFDGKNNPLTFNDIADVKQTLSNMNCPMLDIIPLRRKTNHNDPWDNYERQCGKLIAKPLHSLESCAFDIAYQNPDTDGTPKLILPEDLAKMDVKELKSKLKTANSVDSEKIKVLRRLNDYLANAGDSVMVDYDLETCMIEKVGLDDGELGGSHLGSVDILQKFNNHFNQSIAELRDKGSNDTKNNAINDVDILDNKALKDFDTYFKKANELPLHEGMYLKLFPN